MYTWFQNLNENGKYLFNFRGSFGSTYSKPWFKYQLASGPALKLQYSHGEAGDDCASSMLIFGMGFFTAYITFFLPKTWYFKQKCIATWEDNREFYLIEGREYGFYFYEWAISWKWHAKSHESSSKDPWWMSFYFRIDDFILGRTERLEDELLSTENVFFKIGSKEFRMDSIKWERNRSFRRFIPYVFFHKTWYSVKMEIQDPPLYSGKGENSWDCGDDGSYGMSAPWTFPIIPGWRNRDECERLAIQYYIECIMKDAKRYGGSSSERGVRNGIPWEFIGRVKSSSGALL